MIPQTPPIVDELINMALAEDLGNGDITTRLCVPEDAMANGMVIAKESLIVSGIDVFIEIMKKIDNSIQVTLETEEGKTVKKGEKIAIVKGKASSLLMAERVALNYLQRLCGTATLTKKYIDASGVSASKVRLADTRKTTPGMRYLERRAVISGGGFNHRVDLGGGILIKENHIEAAGSLEKAIEQCKKYGSHPLKIEIEVKNRDELLRALDAGADIVMLDNMTPAEVKECINLAEGRAILEASGGINLDTVHGFAQTGVDVISVGAFTHSAPCCDISFIIELIK
ncbi:MAG: carboxylating nicotinate-nucleotide diphosphorylase [Deltaproteobacteria bacterium]|nr:carboxylating nicotinate-nucleotide diphosphorylase [Deltaproteobacteria bacterium]